MIWTIAILRVAHMLRGIIYLRAVKDKRKSQRIEDLLSR